MKPLALIVSLSLFAACGSETGDDDDDVTPGDAPEVRQVFVLERVGDTIEPRLAYGDHPDIPDTDDRVVTDAVAAYNEIRIVLSQPIEIDALATVLCADGTYDLPSKELEPQDVADCTGVDLSRCAAVCVGVGILDENEDGQPDGRALNPGAVSVECDGVDRAAGGAATTRSPYDAAGGQSYDPAVGADSLGPAIVLETGYLGVNAHCTVDIDDGVTGSDGQPICAPVDGACPSPGDTSAIGFDVESCELIASDPVDGATGVAPDSVVITLQFNIPVDASQLSDIELTDSNGTVVAATIETVGNLPEVLRIDPGPLTPNTTYTVTVPAPCEASISFTTGA